MLRAEGDRHVYWYLFGAHFPLVEQLQLEDDQQLFHRLASLDSKQGECAGSQPWN